MHSMQYRIAVFEHKLASQESDLSMWNECAGAIIKRNRFRLNLLRRAQRMQRYDRVGQASVRSYLHCLIGHNSAAVSPVFKNRQWRRFHDDTGNLHTARKLAQGSL